MYNLQLRRGDAEESGGKTRLRTNSSRSSSNQMPESLSSAEAGKEI